MSIDIQGITPSQDFLMGLIGMDRKKAQEEVQQAGFVYRVVRSNGVAFICTSDFRRERVNVELEDGKVTRVKVG